MKNIKLVALDLDDTTLKSDTGLAPETFAALMETAKTGIEIVVASGRGYTSIPKEILAMEGVNYAISSNGAAIEKAKTGERIYAKTLAPETVQSILDSFPNAMIEGFIEGQPYCGEDYYNDPMRYGCSRAYVSYVQTTRIPVKDVRDLIRENITHIDSIDLRCPDPETKASLYEKAKGIENAYVTSSSPYIVELCASDAGKGTALKALCEKLGVPREYVAAFGNGDNDADMLVFAGLGVAVNNATEYCKACADYICETNNDSGVAKTLYKIINKEPVI